MMTGSENQQSFLDSDKHGEDTPEYETSSPLSGTAKQKKRDLEDISVFAVMMRLVTQACPWLSSTEEFKKCLHKVETSIKERPMMSILYGLILVFGFIPFAGFVLLVCGSFAVFFTCFVFFQFFTVIFSALICAGLFWGMLCCFAMLAVMLGGAVHFVTMWSILARLASRLAQKLTAHALQAIGIPEADLPGSGHSHKKSEE